MPEEKVNVYEREKLYEEVWTDPVTHVAKKYGVSNVAIKKICKSMNIPTPPNGYWAKLAHGKEVHKIPLPEQLNERTKVLGRNRSNTENMPIKFKYGSINFLTQSEQESFEYILSLCDSDQILTGFSCNADITDRLHSRCHTSEAQKDRALRILDRVVARLVKMGGIINDNSSLDIRGEDIYFHLFENQSRCDGKLAFEIHGYGKRDMRIGDTPKRKLEDRIPEIIYKTLQVSEELRNTHLDTLEADLKEKEELRKIKLQKQRFNQEIDKLELLLRGITDYDIALKIRAYVNHVQQKDTDHEKAEWIAWANKKADWYDPVISRTDEVLGIRDHDTNPIPEKKKIPYY
jgi:hypothetical protein